MSRCDAYVQRVHHCVRRHDSVPDKPSGDLLRRWAGLEEGDACKRVDASRCGIRITGRGLFHHGLGDEEFKG